MRPSSKTPGKRAEKTCRSGSWREASNAKSRNSLFHFKPEKVNKFEYCNNKTFFFTQCGNSLETESVSLKQFAFSVRYVYANNRHVNLREGIYCNKSLSKHKPITEDLDNNI